MRSLRSRLILASVLWTAGLLLSMHMLSLMIVHTVPALRGINAAAGAIVAVILMCAGLFTAAWSLTPFRRLRERLSAVRRGHDRRVQGEFPSEVQPLVDELNALIENRERAVRRALAAAGDLAHGLKTPLAVLTQEAERASAAGNREFAEGVGEQVDRMSRQINLHLARARAAASGPDGVAPCRLAPCVEGLVRTLSKLYASRGLDLAASIPRDLFVRVRREDLDEILGNLLDNACKWAKFRVVLAAALEGGAVVLTIDDDGPGLPADVREAVLERGVRMDEATPGSGFGLAIVRDLCEIYRGALVLEDSPLGGLRARVAAPAGC